MVGEASTVLETYLRELGQVPTVSIREKSPWASHRGQGKGTSLNTRALPSP